jgi:putative transposase
VAKTWSPQGCTPSHYHRQRRRDKVSVIWGISVSPRRQRLGLYYQLYFDNVGQEDVCVFLRELLRHVRGQVIVVVDNSSTHKGA